MKTKQIVKIVYRDAECSATITAQLNEVAIRLNYGNGIQVSDNCNQEDDAWDNAFARIKCAINQLTPNK